MVVAWYLFWLLESKHWHVWACQRTVRLLVRSLVWWEDLGAFWMRIAVWFGCPHGWCLPWGICLLWRLDRPAPRRVATCPNPTHLDVFSFLRRNCRACMSKSSGFSTTDRDYYGFSQRNFQKQGVSISSSSPSLRSVLSTSSSLSNGFTDARLGKSRNFSLSHIYISPLFGKLWSSQYFTAWKQVLPIEKK